MARGKCLGGDCRFAHEKRYDAKSKKLQDFLMGCHPAQVRFSRRAMGGGAGGVSKYRRFAAAAVCGVMAMSGSSR